MPAVLQPEHEFSVGRCPARSHGQNLHAAPDQCPKPVDELLIHGVPGGNNVTANALCREEARGNDDRGD